ncbi:MAG TPA: TonB-dependent receptor [Chitinophagales bacterium]|nr:TonB-dependent receptor [Chitinophagales bacterium]HMX03822.1 TonB-dependent receptor [Chitinophagales bacterium]HMZ88032.1 TonB-dependent receptor [Chitinophagales bacterium]HNF68903.1 TonB-dependent receptor [Chitinophagales bacterium]HNI53131.1 TonB-dependent receptor [Chitinophagales bacterium]
MTLFRNGLLVLATMYLYASVCFAQTDTVTLDRIVVTSFKDTRLRESSLTITPITLSDIAQRGAFNISDALAKTPGLSQLGTGNAISKPVIRGLYGNRVLILLSGMRFDNQQWQDEHGLGLSEVGIGSVEVIKGPFSLLHGSDAVGGVINIIEEDKSDPFHIDQDVSVKFNTNTLGEMVQYGYKRNDGAHWIGIRLAAESSPDYSDGNGTRVLNSRYDGYYLKGNYGFKKGNWISDNHYMGSFNRYGFIFSDIRDFFETPDARFSRSFPGPHHIVALNIGTSENTIILPKSVLKVNVGIQSNARLEDEGSGSISLFMHLVTGQYATRWTKSLNQRNTLIIAHNASIENNTNYGKKVIVPDAWMAEGNLAAYVSHSSGKLIFETGIGGGDRYIKTLYTAGVNSPEKDIDPFSRHWLFANVLAGLTFNPNNNWNIKSHVATGVRAPNLAELSSNGLHEGVFTYEIGDPNLHTEKNLSLAADINRTGKYITASISGYYNFFADFIYLSPTDEEWFGFPIYRYLQQSAQVYGAEAFISFRIPAFPYLTYSITTADVEGKLKDGAYLPFIPALKVTPEIKFKGLHDEHNWYAFVNTDIYSPQHQTATDEIATPGYTLLNAGVGGEWHIGKYPLEINLVGNNLLNEAYYDHLSRFKSLGYLNMGTNIQVHAIMHFQSTFKYHNKTN